jgi:hypothetical protein
MVLMAMVQLSFINVIDMVAVRNRFMSAFQVPAVTGCRITLCGILCTHGNRMLIVVAVMRRMEMPVVQVISMPLMLNRGMAALFAVDVYMLLMNVVRHSEISSQSISRH